MNLSIDDRAAQPDIRHTANNNVVFFIALQSRQQVVPDEVDFLQTTKH